MFGIAKIAYGKDAKLVWQICISNRKVLDSGR